MVELTAAIPERVAEELNETIVWVREHLDPSFQIDSAVTEALLAWVADVRLEFINAANVGAVGDGPVPVATGIGGRP